MDEVFKALNDPGRRLLLDALFDADGQTLIELRSLLPDMTRHGVMNHLAVLERAGLITTRKVGRFKHHYLNPVPIRLVHDRWISKYAEPLVGSIARVANRLEAPMTAPNHVYQTFIRATPEAVWNAFVDGDVTVQYYYGTRVQSSWEVGSEIVYLSPNGDVIASGEILVHDAPNHLELTFHPKWDEEIAADGPCRMVWKIAGADGLTSLTVEAWDITPGSRTDLDFGGGLSYIVSGLKTLLETGAPMA